TASAFGQTFVVLGAAGSSSISVMRLDSDGALTPTDHLIDNLTSRFDEVTTLTIAQDGDRVFVIAGGADDGLSLFTLTPSGQLVHLQSLAHFVGGGLQNVDRLQATIEGDALQLFVTSTASPGISQFYVDLGELGDVKPAGSGPTLLDGGAGDDMLVGSDQGRDTLSGGAGDDLLIAGAAGAYLTGGGGADLFVIHPDANETTISDFESGVDILDLSRFSMLYGIGQLAVQPFSWGARITFREATINVRSEDGSALDADDIFGQGFVGPDRVIVLAPDAGDLILGSAGSDTITGTENRDTIRALDGNDYIEARSGDDTVEGNLGNDTIFGGQGDDTIDSGDGHDEVWGGGGDDLLTGGAGNDLMGGSTGNDTIEPGDGNDEAWASAGRDLLRGGNGNDLMGGGTGDDTIYGEAGNDTLWGGRNNDEVHGDAGDDLIGGGPGNDRLWGGLGHDTFWANGGTDLIYGGAGDDLLGAGADNDVVWAEDGNDELRLGKGHDVGYGGAGNDTMRGAGGNDVLFGEDGGDLLFGENGNDQLVGGAGNDTLWGGTGADNFVFEEAQGDDVLRDFELGQDRISILSGASSFAALDMAQQGDDVVIWLGLGSVTLIDVQLGALGAGEFDFG
ncbi:MAG: calcium-binding protein, partial [Pseudomonadota bacterium]